METHQPDSNDAGDVKTSHRPSDQPRPVAGLTRARIGAWMADSWERVWPRILPFLAVVSLFLTVSWLGLWPMMINELRLGLLVLFAAAALLSLYPLRGLTYPTTTEIDTRIERVSQLQHRPVTAQQDNIAHLAGSDDPFARALWTEHRRRMAGSLKNLSAGTPVPKVAARDPYALRAVVALLLFIGFVQFLRVFVQFASELF